MPAKTGFLRTDSETAIDPVISSVPPWTKLPLAANGTQMHQAISCHGSFGPHGAVFVVTRFASSFLHASSSAEQAIKSRIYTNFETVPVTRIVQQSFRHPSILHYGLLIEPILVHFYMRRCDPPEVFILAEISYPILVVGYENAIPCNSVSKFY